MYRLAMNISMKRIALSCPSCNSDRITFTFTIDFAPPRFKVHHGKMAYFRFRFQSQRYMCSMLLCHSLYAAFLILSSLYQSDKRGLLACSTDQIFLLHRPDFPFGKLESMQKERCMQNSWPLKFCNGTDPMTGACLTHLQGHTPRLYAFYE